MAYVIPQQVKDHNLEVLHSANAWWMDRQKVHDLLAAFKFCCTIEEACINAGITLAQYKYFAKLHPVIDEIRDDYKHMVNSRARQIMVREATTSAGGARHWLGRKKPEEFGSTSRRESTSLRMELQESQKAMKEAIARDRIEYSKDDATVKFEKYMKSQGVPPELWYPPDE